MTFAVLLAMFLYSQRYNKDCVKFYIMCFFTVVLCASLWGIAVDSVFIVCAWAGRTLTIAAAHVMVAKYKPFAQAHSTVAGPLIIILATGSIGVDLLSIYEWDVNKLLQWDTFIYASFAIPVLSL